MRIVCVGGGPAGLYFSILMKLRDRAHHITVLERNPRGVTYGWGVVFWDDLLDSLRRSDPETARLVARNAFGWTGQALDVEGKAPVHVGGHGYGIGRQCLLDTLVARATELGVHVEFEREVDDPARLSDADLIVASDGVNSRLRERDAERFATRVEVGRNKYVWLGTTKVFDAFTFAFVESDAGWIWCHAYGFDHGTSTFIVECAPETWSGLGFDTLGADDSLALLEKLFAPHLDGHSLSSQTREHDCLPWLNFRTVTNEHWHAGNLVLMGDAAHTTHFTIGSGTKLALEDAIGLVDALGEHTSLEVALDRYEQQRRTALLQPQSEARFSAKWFESIPRYVGFPAPQFFALLKERRSPLLHRLPPQRYYQLHRISEDVAVLRKIRKWVGPRARALYSRITAPGRVRTKAS